MLKQQARVVAVGVLGGDLALTALSLPVAYAIRAVLPRFLHIVPTAPEPFAEYLALLGLILPIWGLLLYAAGFYQSHRTLPLGEEVWAAMKVAFGGTAILALLVYGLKIEFMSRWFLVVFGVVNC